MNRGTIYTSLISLFVVSVFAIVSAGSDSVIFRAKILVCGDGVAEPQEACDGSDFKGTSCSDHGFAAGNLNCTPACDIETLYCNTPIPLPVVGGGSGGGPVNVRKSQVIFSGVAGSYNSVVVLEDGKIKDTEMASRDGSFRVVITGLNGGAYNFSVYARDDNNKLSDSQSFYTKIDESETKEFKGIKLFTKKAVNMADINEDGKVNLVDFSILLYWFGKPLNDKGVDLNGDGEIDLSDFSILAFYWTG